MLLSKCSALLAGDLQKLYFVFQILTFLHRLTQFYKMCKIVMQTTLENKRSRFREKIIRLQFWI